VPCGTQSAAPTASELEALPYSHELVTGIGGEGATVTRQKLQVARAAGAHSETPLDGFATWPESRGRDEGVRS
jgi:hypothetical protein